MTSLRRILATILPLCLLLGMQTARAQYYSWGADAPSLRWRRIPAERVQILYPDTAAALARHTLRYVEAVGPAIGHGFTHPPLRIPFVLRTENFRSNGLVMWMPKRIEFLTTPDVQSYSMPWIKQLVAHEYRHAVQYNNLNRGLIRILSGLLGEQGATVGLLFMPLWAIEGDAVMFETEVSSFGRGLQPRFTLEYRALGDEVLRRRNCDKWFCGSYREYVPDHYRMGYQMVRYAYDRYGDGFWDRTVRYGVRNAYLLTFATSLGMRKFYGTGEGRLFRESFAALNAYWQAHPAPEDSGITLTPLPEGNYTEYAHPLPLNDTTLVALKTDFDRPARLVEIDTRTGRERLRARVGSVSSRPATDGRRIWWSEYRRSLLFRERVGSRICRLDPGSRRPRTMKGPRNALYPTPLPGGLAWVEYTPDGRYGVVVADSAGRPARRHAVAPFAEIHGLAWDDATRALYLLLTDDEGMHPARLDTATGEVTALAPGAYVTLSDLRAGGGRLYFGSIASGRDEAHALDAATGAERQLSRSRYGSFSPAPGGGTLWTTTYDRRGYRITRQPDLAGEPAAPGKLPRDAVNPPYRRWRTINLDTVRYTPSDSARLGDRYPARRYRTGTRLLKPHSWAPVSFDPFDALEEFDPHLAWGATLLSQNLLSSAEAFATWGWSRREGHLVRGRIRYSGLGVVLAADASYGGSRMVYSLASRHDDGTIERQPLPPAAKYWSAGASATLPLLFDRGRHVRQLSLSAGWNYSNGMVADLRRIRYTPEGAIADLSGIGYRPGLHKLSFGIAFSDAVQSAFRDVATPWGYLLQAGYDLNPANRDFSDLLSFCARLYTPGFFRHNSLSAAVAYQTSVGGYRLPSGRRPLGYKSARLLPRGYDTADIESNRYAAASIDYQFPLCYPEGGIGGIVYFKRIRLNLGADYASFLPAAAPRGSRTALFSYGGDILLDLNFLRMPAASTTTVRLSLYKPDGKKCRFGVGVEIPF